MNKKVEISLQINTSPDLVIKAFTDPKMLNEWWGVQRSLIIPEKGGIYCLAWNISDTGFGFISYGTINRYHPKTDHYRSICIYESGKTNSGTYVINCKG